MINKFLLVVITAALPLSTTANAQSAQFDGFVACGAYYLALHNTRFDWAPDAQTLKARYVLLKKAAIAAGTHTDEETVTTEMTEGGDFLTTMAIHKIEAQRVKFKDQWGKCSNMHKVAADFLQE